MTVDISSEAVERLAARLPENYKEAVTELRENDEIAASMALRAQAERIKELEARCRIASRGLDALSERLPMVERPNSFGYVYHNPDTGVEWGEQHPVESGEVPDATDIQAADLAVLHSNLMLAWQENAILRTEKHADAEAIAALTPTPQEAAKVSAEARENIVDEIESIICETHEMDVRDVDYAENIVSWLERHHPAALRAISEDSQ